MAQETTWLFVELGALGTLRRRAVCVNGGRVTVDIHAVAKAPYSEQAMIETAEDQSFQSGAAIEAVFSDRHIALEGGADSHVSLNDIRLLQDDEPDAFDWFAQLTTRVLAT